MKTPPSELRAITYARFSSTEQRDESIVDQQAANLRLVEQNGWSLVGEYADAAMSGTSDNRPGYAALKKAIVAGKCDVVVAESLDRLSRRLAEVAALADLCRAHRVTIHTCTTGAMNTLTIAVLGGVAQNFLEDLKVRTRRGMRGKVEAGLSAGGLGFGYRVASAADETLGRRIIEETEAAVVRRIFKLYADGMPPRAIAALLNDENVPGPGGRVWGDTTIRGQIDRGTGILNNQLYVGEIVWNRCHYETDPATGRRKAHPNPPSQWERKAAPDLRIVEDDLWNRVKNRQGEVRTEMARDEKGNALNRVHRKRHLLSGVIHCAECSSPFAMVDSFRYACPTHRSKGTCKNDIKIRRTEIEGYVVEILHAHLADQKVIDRIADDFAKTAANWKDPTAADLALARKTLKDTERKIDNITQVIAEGTRSPALLAKLEKLEANKTDLENEIAALVSVTPKRPVYDKAAALIILEQIRDHLPDVIGADWGDTALNPVASVVRELIERIDIGYDTDDSVAITISGDILGLALATGWAEVPVDAEVLENKRPSDLEPEGLLSVVAGARNQRYLRLVERQIPKLAA